MSPSLCTTRFPGIRQYTSTRQGMHHPVNGYLIETDQGQLLIDPPDDLTPEIVRALGDHRPVTQIFVTHWQAEHVEGIRHFPKARVLVSPGDAILAKGLKDYLSLIQPWSDPWDWEHRGNDVGHLAGAANERPLPCAQKVDPILKDGTLHDGMHVVATPGHGKNAVTLILETPQGKIGFCGDLIYGDGQLWNWFDCDWDYGTEMGQKSLLQSVRRLAEEDLILLCPAHGPVIQQPKKALETLAKRLDKVLTPSSSASPAALNFPDSPDEQHGFRKLTPHLFQYRTGNTLILKADSGRAIVIDDGLCIWKPLPERHALHDAIFREAKHALGITQIDWVIPTHYHGDHIEGMARLVQNENARVIALKSICAPLEQPERFNLTCPLWWYDVGESALIVDKKVPENYVLHWEGYQMEFFHLGGQTWYHQGLQVDIDGKKTLIVGDAWWGVDPTPPPVLCWNEAEPTSQGWVFSLHRIMERNPDLLVCGHGSALIHPMPILQEAQILWEERLKDFQILNPRVSSHLFFNPFAEGHTNHIKGLQNPLNHKLFHPHASSSH